MARRNPVRRKLRRSSLRRLVSFVGSPRFREERATARELVAQIDRPALEAAARRHAALATAKYVRSPQRHMEMAVRRATDLGLREGPSRRVLDLGCGTGYLLFAARHFGHEVLGLDLAEDPLFSEMTALLAIPRIIHRIEAFEPLPDLGAPLDLITATAICFNRARTPKPWNAEEWACFLEDCRSRLRPGGRIWLEFNRDRLATFDYLSDETAAALRAHPGASLAPDKSRLLIQAGPP
jgi:SAM-dependent methyltransferase